MNISVRKKFDCVEIYDGDVKVADISNRAIEIGKKDQNLDIVKEVINIYKLEKEKGTWEKL